VELQFDRKRHPHLRDDVCPAIVFDLANLGSWGVETHGVLDAYDRAKVVKTLNGFGLPLADTEYFANELQGDAKIMGFFDTEGPHMALQFAFNDPRKDPDQFVWDLETHLEDWLRTIRTPVEANDYLALYQMKPLVDSSAGSESVSLSHPCLRQFRGCSNVREICTCSDTSDVLSSPWQSTKQSLPWR
jgi:hypothetical protein